MDNDCKAYRKHVVVFILLTLAVSFALQGSRALYERSEGRYAEVAREMMETGNYWEPMKGYHHHWTKPPVTYWAIAAGMRLLGQNEWGARLFNSVALFATMWVITWIGATLWDRETGLVAGFVYASSPFPVLASQALTTDTFLALWEACAVLCYIRADHAPESRWRESWILGMWIFFGLGFATKGPPVLMPLVPMILWKWRRGAGPRLFSIPGLFLFSLVGFAWYLAMSFRHPELLPYFLGVEVMEKIVSDTSQNHEWYKPFAIYIPAFTIGAGPWLYFGVKALLRERLFRPKVLLSRLTGKGKGSFLLLWLLIPLIIFFLIKGRLLLYALPLYAPIALALSRCLSEDRKTMHVRRILATAVAGGMLLVGIKGLTALVPNERNMRHLYEMCRAVSGQGTRFAAVNEAHLYGLQFYLKGQLERLSLGGGREPWADDSLENVLSGIKTSPSPTPYVFVSEGELASDMKKILNGHGLSFQEVDGRFWSLFVMGPQIHGAEGPS